MIVMTKNSNLGLIRQIFFVFARYLTKTKRGRSFVLKPSSFAGFRAVLIWILAVNHNSQRVMVGSHIQLWQQQVLIT